MPKLSIELDYDQVEEITILSLINSYEMQITDIENIDNKLVLSDVDKQNLKDFKRIKKALKKVISFYTTLDMRIELGLDF